LPFSLYNGALNQIFMDGNGTLGRTRMDRIFAHDCEECMKLSEKERQDIAHISDLVMERIIGVFEMRILRVNIGTTLKLVARELVDRFVAEMSTRGLQAKYIGLIAQNVLRRLEEYLNTGKN